MNLKEKMTRFKKRWNIVDDTYYEENFQKFRTRVISILRGIDNHVREDGIELFCQYYGISESWHTPPYEHSYSTSIIDKLTTTTTEVEFYELLELIFALDIVGSYAPRGIAEYSKEILLIPTYPNLC